MTLHNEEGDIQAARFKSVTAGAFIALLFLFSLFCSPAAALLFNLHRLMVCVTLLQGIVGDVQGYTPSFHVPPSPPPPPRVHADLFSVQHTHPFFTDAHTQV